MRALKIGFEIRSSKVLYVGLLSTQAENKKILYSFLIQIFYSYTSRKVETEKNGIDTVGRPSSCPDCCNKK
jgi:hypothetical protein